MREQTAPYAIQIELSEGCNLYCSFCGLRGIREQREKNFKFMSLDVIADLGRQIRAAGWNARLELAMHGEPTMHPEYAAMVAELRARCPKNQIMMTSNGGGLLQGGDVVGNVVKLFEAGLTILALDDYVGVKIVGKVRAVAEKIAERVPGLAVHEYPAVPEGNPHHRLPPGQRMITLMQDISVAVVGTHSSLNNHAGAAAPPNQSAAGRRCAKPFREMSVRWDGSVAVCCNDWRGTYKCGNVTTDGLLTVWNGPAFDAARRRLIRGERTFGPCNGCDAKSYRVGLLPDPLGKVDMPEEDAESLAALEAAVAGAPYTARVAREWEL